MHLGLLFLALLQAAVKGAECPCNESHDSSTTHTSFLQEESAANVNVDKGNYGTLPPGSGFLQKESAVITEQGNYGALPPGTGFLQEESAANVDKGNYGALPPGTGFLQEESAANVDKGNYGALPPGTGFLQEESAANVDKGNYGSLPPGTGFLQEQATLNSDRQNFYVPFPPGAGGKSSMTPLVLLEKDTRMRAKLQPKTMLQTQVGFGRKSNRA